jgi:hypothetical protein
MTRIIRTLFALLLVSLAWNFMGKAMLSSATHAAAKVCLSVDNHPSIYAFCDYHYSQPLLPDMPNAEWEGTVMPARLLTFIRTQRSLSGEELLFFKESIDRLNTRTGILSQNNEKTSCDHPLHSEHFACEYYVFSLRHILI